MSEPVRAVVGARVSALIDGKESQIVQRTKGTAYAESQGWIVVGEFEDLDVSAIKKSPWERPDLRVWLGDRSGDWDALIFAKTDRVFRSANDCVTLAEWCKDNRKLLVLVDDGIRLDYFHPESEQDAFAGAMSKVFLILASVFAEIEGQRFVQRARDRVTQYRHQPRWAYGIPPFGFQVIDNPHGAGKALGHDPAAQAVLHQIKDKLLAGGSMTGIAADLNDSGTLSPQDWHRARSGKPTKGTRWTVDKLKAIMSGPSTQGIKTANGKPVLDAEGRPVHVGPESFPPDVWHRIQQELAQRSQEPRKRRHSTNPLLGVAKCALCGKNMRQRSQTTPAGVTHRYYVCGNSPKACSGVSVIAADAEQMAEAAFLRGHLERRITRRVWRDGSDHSTDLEQINQTIEGLREDRALGLFPTPEDQQKFRAQMSSLIARRDALDALPIVKAGWVDVEVEQTYGDVWATSSAEDKREMMTGFIELRVTRPDDIEIVVDPSKRIGDGEIDDLDKMTAAMDVLGLRGVTINSDGTATPILKEI